jgi:hypothetical protein
MDRNDFNIQPLSENQKIKDILEYNPEVFIRGQNETDEELRKRIKGKNIV